MEHQQHPSPGQEPCSSGSGSNPLTHSPSSEQGAEELSRSPASLRMLAELGAAAGDAERRTPLDRDPGSEREAGGMRGEEECGERREG